MAVTTFQSENLDARLAEYEADADAGAQAIRDGFEAVLRGCEVYAVAAKTAGSADYY